MSRTHAGLFEGYGGTTMAARVALGPLDTLWHSDIKPASVALLAHHHPDTPNVGDLTRLWPAIGPLPREALELPRPDVLTASWPCQPHSSAGKRLGDKDPRALLPNLVRAVDTLRPRILLAENVARVASNGELGRAASSLARIGYVGAWRCLNASDVGAPHKRARCFLVAVDASADARGRGLTEHAERHRATLPGQDGERGGDPVRRGVRGEDRVTLLPTPTPTPTQPMTTGAGTSGRDGGLNLQTAAARFDASTWGPYEAAVRRWEPIVGRPAPSPVQPAARPPHGPQLSPRFVEWMMGVPEGWVTDVPTLAPRSSSTRGAALSLLGDGVVPQQGAVGFRLALDALVEIGRVAV